MSLRSYETIVIVRTEMEEGGVDQIQGRLVTLLEKAGGTMVKTENWGKRKLAYEMKKQPRGIYLYSHYLASPDVVKEFERFLRINDNVLKYISVLLDDDVDAATFNFEAERARPTPLMARANESERRRERRESEGFFGGRENRGDDDDQGGEGWEDDGGEPRHGGMGRRPRGFRRDDDDTDDRPPREFSDASSDNDR